MTKVSGNIVQLKVSGDMVQGGAAFWAGQTPAGLVLTVLSDTSIKLDWTDNSTNEDGFSIERSPDNATWVEIVTVAAGVTTYTDATCVADTIYYYKVRVFYDDTVVQVIPAFVSAIIGDDTRNIITVTFDRDLQINSFNILSFTVTDKTITDISIKGTTIILTVSVPFVDADMPTLTYIKPINLDETIKALVGGVEADAFAEAVTNNSTQWVYGANFLTDNGFEAGLANNKITGLINSRDSATATLSSSAEQKHSGNYSGKLLITANTNGQWFLEGNNMVVGQRYKHSVWVYNPSGQSFPGIRLGEGGGASTEVVSTNLTNQWVYLERIQVASYDSTTIDMLGSVVIGEHFYIDDWIVKLAT